MCYRPLHIKNKSKYLSHVGKRIFTVPCGQCVECQREKQLSWFVRLYFEFDAVRDFGGVVLYLTFTYNNNNLPRIQDKDSNIDIPAFKKHDIQQYIHNIRTEYKRKYGEDLNFKYFISSEYGGKTHRPHYHGIFYIYSHRNKYFLLNFFRAYWKHGFTAVGKFGAFVNGVGALNYVAKYVAKDITLQHISNKCLSKLPNDYDFKAISSDKGLALHNFHLQSTNLGISALWKTKDSDLELGITYLPDSKYGQKAYKLPLYLDRKMFYQVVKIGSFSLKQNKEIFNPTYVLTKDGERAQIKRISKFENQYNKVLDIVLSERDSYPFDVQQLNERFHTHFKTCNSAVQHLKKYFSRSLLTLYNFGYKGYNNYYPTSYAPDDSIDTETLWRFRHDLTRLYRISCNVVEPIEDYYLSVGQYLCDYRYDLASDIIDYFYHYINLSSEEEKEQQQLAYEDRKSELLVRTEQSAFHIDCGWSLDINPEDRYSDLPF